MSCTDIRKRAGLASGLFLAFALMFFLPVDIPFKMSFPMLVLGIAAIGILPWQLCAAAFFSCLGDTMAQTTQIFGPVVAQIGQIVGFALAQICYSYFFIGYTLEALKAKRAAQKKLSKKAKAKVSSQNGLYTAMVFILVWLLLNWLFSTVAPAIDTDVIRYSVMVYGVLIATMLFSGLMTGDWIWGLGAALFVFSDSVIAVRNFLHPVPYSSYVVMIPYYAAQLIIFSRSVAKLRCASEG